MKPKIELSGTTYHIGLAGNGHLGDDVYLETSVDSGGRFRICNMPGDEKLSLSYKTLPELSAYLRALAAAVDTLAERIGKGEI